MKNHVRETEKGVYTEQQAAQGTTIIVWIEPAASGAVIIRMSPWGSVAYKTSSYCNARSLTRMGSGMYDFLIFQ